MVAVFFPIFLNDLPQMWKNRNSLVADDATFYAIATALTDVQWDLSNTETWTWQLHKAFFYNAVQ